jgi:hypothetical protein
LSGCGGLNNPAEMALEKTEIDHLLAKGVATFVVDPFTPRNEPQGICANLDEKTFGPYASRGGNDATRRRRRTPNKTQTRSWPRT